MTSLFTARFPWIKHPLIVSAPMRLIALAPLAVAVSMAGGLGFIGVGYDLSNLEAELQKAKALCYKHGFASSDKGVLPVGVGLINWGADLTVALKVLKDYPPAAVWLFAPKRNQDLVNWSNGVRAATHGKTEIWVQIGTVADAAEIADICSPDVFVVQGSDAGGHGLEQGASIVTLLPEVTDALKNMGKANIDLVATGGIVEGRGVAASLALGAKGVVMGTRFLASEEAQIAKGYQDDVLRSNDGGISTVRSKVYDTLRGTVKWPNRYGGRGIINESYRDAHKGEVTAEMRRLHDEALEKGDAGWGEHGRLTAYAGTGVGLIHQAMSASVIINEVRSDAIRILQQPKL